MTLPKIPLAALLTPFALLLTGCVNSPGSSSQASTAVAPAALALEAVPLVTHEQFGVFEMDAFVDRGDGQGVYRAQPGDSPASLVYTTATTTAHDPTFKNDGPFPRGASTGVTLADWLSARGAVAYACQGGKATVDASFAHLVPNGAYTLWYARFTMTKGAITGDVDKPLGAADGSQNAVKVDGKGNAKYHLADAPCLLPTTLDKDGTGYATLFALAYHSDGAAHGPVPGDFGSQTHVQLFAMAAAPTGA